MTIFCYTIGAACILYCLTIGVFVGHGTNFFLIWGVLGVLLTGFGFLWKKGLPEMAPAWIKWIFTVLVASGLVIFVLVEGCILSGFTASEEEEVDYLIVLGAQLKQSGPSRVLQMRLDEAYDYLTEHENTIVIVSGGQGFDEPDTEAEGMYQYLVKRGIESGRIIKEEQSCNTVQNIEFSSVFLEKEKHKVGIVSNNFHIFRAVRLAKHAGYEHVSGIAAPSEPALLPNNMLREFFGVLKDFAVGNM